MNLEYTELPQFSLKEDLVNDGYPLFAEEVISRPQYAEEFRVLYIKAGPTKFTISNFISTNKRSAKCKEIGQALRN